MIKTSAAANLRKIRFKRCRDSIPLCAASSWILKMDNRCSIQFLSAFKIIVFNVDTLNNGWLFINYSFPRQIAGKIIPRNSNVFSTLHLKYSVFTEYLNISKFPLLFTAIINSTQEIVAKSWENIPHYLKYSISQTDVIVPLPLYRIAYHSIGICMYVPLNFHELNPRSFSWKPLPTLLVVRIVRFIPDIRGRINAFFFNAPQFRNFARPIHEGRVYF